MSKCKRIDIMAYITHSGNSCHRNNRPASKFKSTSLPFYLLVPHLSIDVRFQNHSLIKRRFFHFIHLSHNWCLIASIDLTKGTLQTVKIAQVGRNSERWFKVHVVADVVADAGGATTTHEGVWTKMEECRQKLNSPPVELLMVLTSGL